MQSHRPFLMIIGMILAAILVQRGLFWLQRDARCVERMIEEAPGLIERLPEEEYPRTLREWFQALTEAGYVTEAKRLALAARSEGMKTHALAAVAHGLFSLGKSSEAAEIARTIPDPQIRDQTLRIVAMSFALGGSPFSGKGARAVETASSIEAPTTRSMGLQDTALALRLTGQERSAESAAHRIDKPSIRDQAEAAKAAILAIKGQAREAMDTAKAIPTPFIRTLALKDVAEKLLQRGFPGAVEAAEAAVASATRGTGEEFEALSTLAAVLAGSGDLPRAREVAGAVTETEARSRALSRLVEALIARQETARALEIACGIPEPAARCSALSRLIEGSPGPGSREVPSRAASALLSAAGTIKDPEVRAQAYHEGALALAKSGLREESFRAAEQEVLAARQVKEPLNRMLALSGAARARSEAQPGPDSAAFALSVLDEIGRHAEPSFDFALPDAVEALMQAAPDEQAVEQAGAIKDPRTRALVLASLADKLGGYAWNERVALATRAATGALEAARSLSVSEVRGPALVNLMEVVARADLIPQALEAVRSLWGSDAPERSEALCKIASTVGERGRYEEAWQIARECSPRDKLLASAAILRTAREKPEMRRFAARKPIGK